MRHNKTIHQFLSLPWICWISFWSTSWCLLDLMYRMCCTMCCRDMATSSFCWLVATDTRVELICISKTKQTKKLKTNCIWRSWKHFQHEQFWGNKFNIGENRYVSAKYVSPKNYIKVKATAIKSRSVIWHASTISGSDLKVNLLPTWNVTRLNYLNQVN